MFETLYTQIGVVVVLAIVGFAFWKGGEPERVGAGAYVLGMLASLVIQSGEALRGPQWGMMGIDVVMLAIYSGLAWKSRRAWPVWASALQALVVMSHILKILNFSQTGTAFVAVINLAGYGILVALAVGTFWAWQERRAAGLE